MLKDYVKSGSVLFTNDPTDGKLANPNFTVDGIKGEYRSLNLYGDEKSQANEMHVILGIRKVKDSENVKKGAYGYGKVEGVRGMFLLPDYWDCNACPNFVYDAKILEEEGWKYIDYDSNVFSTTTKPTWSEMEEAGVVFLPAVGYRYELNGTKIKRYKLDGHYWMSNDYGDDDEKSRGFYFNETAANPTFIEKKYVGYPIRLVYDK